MHTRVILLEEVLNLGKFGDIVTAKTGFVNNYLIPKGKARRATPEILAKFESERAELEKKAREKLQQAQELASRLQTMTLLLEQKAGIDGKLFGSVTNLDIARLLNKQGITMDKHQIRLPEGLIKTTGEHRVHLVLHADVSVDLTLTVVEEKHF